MKVIFIEICECIAMVRTKNLANPTNFESSESYKLSIVIGCALRTNLGIKLILGLYATTDAVVVKFKFIHLHGVVLISPIKNYR